jgi:diacylglycerol O-acyltransferase / wax synthase
LPKDYRGDFFEDYKRHIADRLHLADVFERKLASMPFELSNPVWVDDADVDIDYHIRRVTLSKPGTFKQLEQMVGRLHSSLLDRSRPLWEFTIIEGLETGQPALYSKVHHAAVDGQAGVALAKAVYDLTPEPRPIKPPRQRPRSNEYQLGMAELASAALQNTVQQYVKLVTTLPNAMRAVANVAMPILGNPMRSLSLPSTWAFAPKTPLNVSITNQRAFAARSVSLGEVKLIAKTAGVSLNDVVLAACATALKRYLAEYNCTPDKPLVAAVPVSLREAGNTDMNNQVSMMLVSLATDVADPVERMKAINASSSVAKEMSGSLKAAIPTDFPSFGAPWIMTSLASLFGRSRLTDQLPPLVNVAISNVPGAPVPLYSAGARLATYFPVSIPSHGCALNITVQSYNGSLDYGLTACRKALPDVDDLADYVVEAHAELRDRVLGARAMSVPPAATTAASPAPKLETRAKLTKTPRTAPAKLKVAAATSVTPVRKRAPAAKPTKPKARKAKRTPAGT